MAGDEGSNSRLRILRRMMTVDGSGRNSGPPPLVYLDAGARRSRASPPCTNPKGPESLECDALDSPEDGRKARACSDSLNCHSSSLFVDSTLGSPEYSRQQPALPHPGRFGLKLMRNSRDKDSRGNGILAALNAAGWRGLGSTPEPSSSHTPVCTPPSPSETLSTPRQPGFVKLAPWTRNRGKSFLATPRSMRNPRRTSWGKRNPKISPDLGTESEATCPTCPPSSSTPSSSPPSSDGSSEEPEFPPMVPRRNIRAVDPLQKCKTPEESPPRISRLTFESVNQLSQQSVSVDKSAVDVADVRMVGATQESYEGERSSRIASDITLLSTVSSSRSFSDSTTESRGKDEAVAGREDDAGAQLPTQGIRSIAAGEKRPPRARRPRSSCHRVRFLQPSPKTYVAKESSGRARGSGADDALARLQDLIAEDRGWPWAGRRIVSVQYVSIGGQHRWIRSEGCRNAILLVTGAMFLLELPVDALSGPDSGEGVHQGHEPPPRGWYVKVDARSLKSMSVPMGSEEVDLWASEENSGRPQSSSQCHTDHGVIFHARSGACVWVNCGNGISRDSLVRAVTMWHISETKTSVLDLRHMPRAEAEAGMRSNQGGVMRSLLSERKSCLCRASVAS